ncbi:MAG: PAS domain S-box protein, partial [Smithella sp.]
MTLKPTYEELEQKVKLLEEQLAKGKQVEESLHDTEKLYHLLFDHSPDGVVIVDPATARFLDFNETTCLMLGYTREEFSKLSIFDLEANQTPEEIRLHIEYVIKHGISDFETRQRTKQGKIINLHVTAQSTEVLGKPVYHCIWRDITDRKQAEHDLLREMNQLQTILNLYHRADTRIQDIEAGIIEECVRISESRLGFFGLINEDETVMMAHLWSEQAMEGCAIDFKPVEFPIDHAGIWAEAIRKHETLIVNDYLEPDPRKKGYPEGHVPIKNLMSIPIIKGGKAVAIMAVANKKLDYNETDVLHLSLFLESVWDILKRVKAEEELRKTLNLLNSIGESSTDAIYVKDIQGRYLLFNKEAAKVTGKKPEEVIGKDDYFLFPADEAKAVMDGDRRVLESGQVMTFEEVVTTTGGTVTYLSTKGPLCDSEGKVFGLFGIARDITKYKQMEAALKESERRLADIIDFLPDATFAIDLSGKVIAWNRAIEEMTGVKAEDILGKGNHEYAVAFYGMQRPMLIDKAIGAAETDDGKYDFVKRKGNLLLAEGDVILKGVTHFIGGKAGPLYDSHGNIVGAIESVRDITERKLMEAALKESERRLADIIDFL